LLLVGAAAGRRASRCADTALRTSLDEVIRLAGEIRAAALRLRAEPNQGAPDDLG
jgi:hypothetical protein